MAHTGFRKTPEMVMWSPNDLGVGVGPHELDELGPFEVQCCSIRGNGRLIITGANQKVCIYISMCVLSDDDHNDSLLASIYDTYQMMRESVEMAHAYVTSYLPLLLQCFRLPSPINPLYHPRRDLHIHAPFWTDSYDTEYLGSVAGVAILSYATARPMRPEVGIRGMLSVNGELYGVEGGCRAQCNIISSCINQGLKKVVLGGDPNIGLEGEAKALADAHGIVVVMVPFLWQALDHLFDMSSASSSSDS